VKAVLIGVSVYKQSIDWVVMAIKSVFNQSYGHWHLRIRLDGRDALSCKDIEMIRTVIKGEERADLVIGESRLGCFGSYHEIFDACKADYLAQLDADDLLSPDALLKSIEVLERNPHTPFTYSLCALINEKSEIIGYDKRALGASGEGSDILSFKTFHLRVVRSSVYKQCGGYDGSYMYAGDYDLSLRLSEFGDPLLIRDLLYLYRIYPNSTSQKKKVATHLEGVRAVRSALQRRSSNPRNLLIQSPRTQTVSLLKEFTGPILITGMHRSGTSVLARILQKSIGIDLGRDLLAKDKDNPDGYYEDTSVIKLHSEWFHQSLSKNEDEWADWGIDGEQTVGSLGNRLWDKYGEDYIAFRVHRFDARLWGWKDPRSCMILPYWSQLLRGNCLVIGIYRSPWDVCDSLQRIAHGRFRKNPDLALRIWKEYNKRMIEYCLARPEQICLVSSSTIVSEPHLLSKVLAERWGIKEKTTGVEDLRNLIRSNKLITLPFTDPLPYLYEKVYPDIFELWGQLNQLADISCRMEGSDLFNSLEWPQSSLEPVLSVIIPTLNPSNLLLEAIASILREGNQKQYVYEIIIVDDGSTFNSSLDLLEKLNEQCGIKVLRQCNQGLALARNRGIHESRGEFILPLDDDNKVLAPYMNQAVSVLSEDRKIDLVYGDRKDFGATSRIFCPGSISTVADLVQFNRIDACAVFRRSLWEESGGYDPCSNPLEDWDLWITALKQGKGFYYLRETCFEYRVREASMLQRHLSNHEEHSRVIHYLRDKHELPLGRLDGR